MNCSQQKLSDTLQTNICRALGKHEEVVCGYVFGSTLRAATRPRDLDIAVFIDRGMTGGNILPSTVSLLDRLKHELNRTDIDVLPLNDASHAFRHEVISTGVCVYARSEEERVEFETRAEMTYFDFLPTQRFFDEATLYHIRKKRQ